MQNQKFVLSVLLFSVFTTAQAQTTGDLFKNLAKQTLGALVVTNAPAVVMPPKPSGLTHFVRVGPSELFVAPDIRDRMGGNEVTIASRNGIQDLLISSGRFTVNDDPTSPYRFIATVADFQSYEIEMKNKSAVNALANQFLKANINTAQAPINWDKDQSLIYVKCGVSLNFEDTRTRELLFSGQGTFERKSMLSALQAELLGLEAARNAATTGNVQTSARMSENEIKTRLFEYAAQQALKDMLPKLDAYLLGLQPAAGRNVSSEPAKVGGAAVNVQPAKPGEVRETAKSSAAAKPASPAATAPKAKFCTSCGNRVGGEDKFCGNCGTAVKR